MSRSGPSVSLRCGAAVLAAALAFVAVPPEVAACGLFSSVRLLKPEQRPTLAREKVLIVHDAARGREHFIREVAFRQADQALGFVVPTPTRPEVAEVAKNPFTRLRDEFPFERELLLGFGKGAGAGYGGGGGGGVEVIAVEKVGSFTAFTLAATDAAALAGWLKDNELASTPETERWLEHYVKMGFYYVALRYDPPADAKSRRRGVIGAETVRISFDTPVAYYPYFEPEATHSVKSPRLLEVWFVGSEAVVPVARLEDDGKPPRWVRPLKAGKEHRRARRRLQGALLDELEALLPEGELVVQTFQDQKRRRAGYQDILFAAATPRALAPEQQAVLEPLLAVLDPGLAKEAE